MRHFLKAANCTHRHIFNAHIQNQILEMTVRVLTVTVKDLGFSSFQMAINRTFLMQVTDPSVGVLAGS